VRLFPEESKYTHAPFPEQTEPTKSYRFKSESIFCYNQLSAHIEEERVPGTAVGQGRIGAAHTLFVQRPCKQSLLSEHAASIAPLGPAIADVVS
jgi:hypothetical protein